MGFLAITYIVEGKLQLATVCIFIAGIFDFLDGLIARKLKQTSLFGLELDSLADLVSFGAAPALLIWRFVLSEKIGFIIASFLLCTGAIRLARFNIIGQANPRLFIGLPIPASAITVIALVNAGFEFETVVYAGLFACLAVLNISNFVYPSQKQPVSRTLVYLLLILIPLAIVAAIKQFIWKFIFGLCLAYLIYPLVRIIARPVEHKKILKKVVQVC
jgi:CDP-diacylglycerol--serine O-phosphatidyltransferase